MKKDAYYFSHDSNAHKDPKILKLRARFGWEGYGIFWAIIETLREQESYSWRSDEKELLSFSFANGEPVVNQVIDYCIDIGLLIVTDEGMLQSDSLNRRMEIREEKRRKKVEAGRKGALSRWKNGSANGDANGSAIDEPLAEGGKGKESKGKESKENIPYKEIVDYLNSKTGKSFKPTARKTKELIQARWNEGFELEDFKKVVDVCVNRWQGKIFSNGAKGDDYLQPSTLFNGKFDERLNWSKQEEKKSNVFPMKSNSVDMSDWIQAQGW